MSSAPRRLLPLTILALALLAGAAWWLARGPNGTRAARTGEPTGALDGARDGERPAVPAPRAEVDTAQEAASGTGRRASLAALSPAASGSSGPALTGRVEGPTGQAIAGATVWLFPDPVRPGPGARPEAETTTDEDGRFRLAGLVEGARWSLHAQADGHRPRTVTAFTGVDAEVTLGLAARITGRVLTARDLRPVPGAEVSIARSAFTDGGWARREGATTDSEGRFVLALAAPGIESLTIARPGSFPETFEIQVPEAGGEGYELRVSEPVTHLALVDLGSGAPLTGTDVECGRVTVRTDEAGRLAVPAGALVDDELLELRLRRPGGAWTAARLALAPPPPALPLAVGARVLGRVVDALDAPVAGASVRRVGGGRPPGFAGLPPGVWLEEGSDGVTTGADGRFELTGLLPRGAPVRVRAHAPELADGDSEPFELETLASVVETLVRLERGATITGRVTVNGTPASVVVQWNGERGRGWTRSDPGGAYRLPGVAAGTVTLGARLETEERGSPCDEDLVLAVPDGAALKQDLARTARASQIVGRVLDALGRPLAGVRVRADARVAGRRTNESAESDVDGRFAIALPDTSALAPQGGEEPRWRVRASDGAREVVRDDVASGTFDLVLTLPARARLTVEVLDARTRDALPGFRLYWRLHALPERTPDDPEDDVAGREWERVRVGGRSPAPGPDGRFVVELPAARLDLVATAPGHALSGMETVDLAPDGAGPTLRFLLDEHVLLVVEVAAVDETPEERASTAQAVRKQGLAVVPDDLWAERRRGGELLRDVRRSRHFDEAGDLVVRGLAPGPVRLVDAPRGVTLAPTRLTLPPVDRHRVRVEAQAARRPPKPGGDRR